MGFNIALHSQPNFNDQYFEYSMFEAISIMIDCDRSDEDIIRRIQNDYHAYYGVEISDKDAELMMDMVKFKMF